MISKEYSEILLERKLKEFILSNRRSPSALELINIKNHIEEQYYNVDEVGISGKELQKIIFREVSSIEKENAQRSIINDDFKTMTTKASNLFHIEEESFRGLVATLNRSTRIADELSSRLDNLLLLSNENSPFLYGIEETFSNNNNIDIETSTCMFTPKGVMIGRYNNVPLNLNRVDIVTSIYTDKPYISYTANNKLDSLKSIDGNIWKAEIKTNYLQGSVALVFTIDLKEKKDLHSIVMKMIPINGNSLGYMNCFYSNDGSTYNPLITNLNLEEYTVIPIGITEISKIQFVIYKNSADITYENNEYGYLYLLDQIEIFEDTIQQKENSLFVSKNYDLYSQEGTPIYYTKATFEACTIEPEGTGISFSISNDNVTWIPVQKKRNGINDIILFGNDSTEDATSFIDMNSTMYSVIDTNQVLEDNDSQDSALLNRYITSSYANKFSIYDLKVKRNIVTPDSPDIVMNTSPGWVFDKSTATYSTVAYVSNQNGLYIDLGTSTAILNGKSVTGRCWLPAGYNLFSTNKRNWNILPVVTDLVSLEKADQLYPYNHKYLIEGYKYNDYFKGDQIYTGVNEYYGIEMEYISNEEFELLDSTSEKFLKCFTTETIDDNTYIKIKVNKKSSTWQLEFFDLDVIIQNSNSNSIYVKAELNSSKSNTTPILLSYKVQVI